MRALAVFLLLAVSHTLSAQLYGTGLVFNDDNYAKAKSRLVYNTDEFKDLPSAASIKEYSPKPGNQLQLNTSPSWAAAWSAQSILFAEKNHNTDRQWITQNTFSPAYTYYHVRKPEDENCEAGIDLYNTLNFLKNSGTMAYDDFLEFCPKGIPEDVVQLSPDNQISDFIKLFDEKDPNQKKIDAVKKSISEHFPVVTGMYCPPSFFTAKNFWQPTEVLNTDFPGHALCVIGYDDNKFGGAFEIINSWGSRWGNNGYMWIRYTDFTKFTKYAYEVFSIHKDKKDRYQFSGKVKIRLNSGYNLPIEKVEDGIFKTENPMRTGTYFRLYLDSLSPAFVYVFGIDAENNYFKLFPHKENISPALIYKTNETAIPGENNYIEIINDPGEEKLCILYSKNAIDFENLIDNLTKYPGDLSENIDVLLGDQLIPANTVSWDENGIGFSAESKTGTALFVQILIVHI